MASKGYPHNSQDYHPQGHAFDEFVGYHSGNIDFVSQSLVLKL